MANFWTLGAVAWCLIVLGWLLLPIVSLLVTKLFANLVSVTSRRLRSLEPVTIPKLKQTLVLVEEKRRVWRAMVDERPLQSDDLKTLDELAKELKSALNEAEDILDLVKYHQIKKSLLIGSSMESWSAPWTIGIAQALLQRCVRRLAPVFPAESMVLQRLRAWSRHLDIGITNCCRSMFTWSVDLIAAARYYRDWSYEQVVGNLQEDGAAVDSLLPVTCAMRLEKRLKNIEHILSVCRESDVLNQQLIRSTVKENSSQQEVINDLHGTVIEQMVYGREKDRDDICTMLREGSDPYAASSCARQPYSVIVIHGITGSGKSTLAQYVYQHEKKAGVKYFDPIIFIHVSKTFRLHDICRDMLKEITGQDRQSNSKDLQSLESLSKELKTKLQGRRFLLVLDDVNLDEWVMLHKVLDDAQPQCGSRILVTAQKVDAAIGPPLMKLWPIPELGEDEYLSLLMHHALPAGADDYEGDYEGVGRQIVKKLHRSPIAAVAVGKRLQMNNNIKFWRAAVHLDVLNETMGALRWSYQQLGGDIRRCFKYCSTFPRGYKLQRHELVRIWIAQGFVKNINCETEDLEDLGQSYFDELVSFSFLHPQGTMNDMVHKLAEWAAGSDFFRIDLTGSTKETPPEVLPPEVLHLFIETNNRADITEKILDLGNLRTLIIEEYNNSMDHKENHDLVKEEIFRSMFIKLKKLRVLIVKITHHHSLVFSVPASIDQMKHLRYISFNCSGDNLEMIFPNQFSKLYHMQIIDAYNPRFPHPEDMANLIHLRQIPGHVQFPNVGRLTSLQMMPLFVVRKEQGYELKQLKRLNKLGGHLTIEGLGNVGSKVEALEADLSRKEGLNKLKLNFSSNTICNPVIEAEVLEGLRPPNNLTELTIKGYKGFRYPNWMLNPQHLVTSKNFKLVLNQCTQLAYIPDENELFSGLRSLCIHDCDWDSLPVDMVHLKSLKFLDITRCHKIEVIPSLPLSLVYISIDSCKVLSRTCKDKEHPNWEKVQRIHTKRIP